MSESVGELNLVQVRELLTTHHLGRLTCPGEPSRVLTVSYRIRDADHIDVETNDRVCNGLAREQSPVRFEVDDASGPTRWSIVLGWGVFEGTTSASAATYRIRITRLRGFYHGAQPPARH